MRRREFISLLGGAAAWPLDALAQQSGKVWRMGFIAHGHESFYDALFEGLREYGYEEGRNLMVERRYARGQVERFKEFAADMVRLNVDIVIVVTTPAALAVMNATKTIPIVHPNAIDPLDTGLIVSLARPGKNLTGGAQLTAEVSAKRLEILKKVLPGLSRAAALWNPANPAIVFLHGLGVSSWMWNEQVEGLQADYYCVRIDLPENGESYQVPASAVHDARTGPQGAKVIATYVVEKGKPLASPAQ